MPIAMALTAKGQYDHALSCGMTKLRASLKEGAMLTAMALTTKAQFECALEIWDDKR